MGKGAKIALGCGCVVLLAAGAMVAMFGFGAFWVKSKVAEMGHGFDQAASRSEEIQRWSEKAAAVPYTAPADGVIAEDRLLKFLEVRRRVHDVYQGYGAELRQLQARTKESGQALSLSETVAAGGRLAEAFSQLRLSQARALAELQMNEAEYRDVQLAVYKTAWAVEARKQSGQLPSEAVSAAGEKVEQSVEKAMAEAAEHGVPGAGAISEEQKQQVREAMSQAAEATRAVEAPQANIDLFRRHEAEIRRYAMTGLELFGL